MTEGNQLLHNVVMELEDLLLSENSPIVFEEFSPEEFNDIWERLEDMFEYWKAKAKSDPRWQQANSAITKREAKAWEDAYPEVMKNVPKLPEEG